jgi:ribonuclease P protein component
MLKRVYRLPSAVRLVHAKTIPSQIVLLKTSTNGLSYNRFGFTISKKVAKTAVERNRTKRKIRACVESLFEQITKGNDFLFIIRKNVADIDEQMICSEIRFLLEKGGYLL